MNRENGRKAGGALFAARAAMTRWMMIVACGGLVACGGRVLEESGTNGSSSSKPEPSASSAAAAGASNSSPPLPRQTLGECKPGFDAAQNPERVCDWIDQTGTCFPNKDDACNCICPLDRDSACFSAFPTPGVPTLVSCI